MQDGEDDDAMPGQDSFIDVVCNMVGILIVLVMIVGVRASSSEYPSTGGPGKTATRITPVSLSADPKALAELEASRRRAEEAMKEIDREVAKFKDLSVQSALIEARREQLSIAQAAVEQDVKDRRAKLDAEGQKQFDVQREIAAAEIKLHELTQEQVSLIAETTQVEEVECVPTPLAKTVTGAEIHVRLRHGQLAVVPAEALMDEVQRRGADHLRSGLNARNEAEDVFGPIDGFRMRLSIERYNSTIPGAPANSPQRAEVVMQGVFLPVSDDIGQPLDQALLPNSAFMRALRATRTAAPAVTVWVYPDSYGELRLLKRAMWEAGSPMAVRPLPDGHPIVFSTAGSKSSAQ
ncbi:MAG: hypothetical protein H0T51_17035 [Pirellulales bacterium]|nr:hypothetical protein [Pirellulales bacterium]